MRNASGLNHSVMKRVIRDYRSLSDEEINLLHEKFPHGVNEDDLVTLKRADGTYIDVLQLELPDEICLVRFDKMLQEQLDITNLIQDSSRFTKELEEQKSMPAKDIILEELKEDALELEEDE